MADYPISNVPRRVQYVNTGVGPYLFNFEILTQTDIAVYRGSTLLTLTTDYTVTINGNGTGSVTLTTAGTGNITIVGARAIQRTSDYTTNGDLFANTLNTDLDSQTIYSQQLAETLGRTIKLPVTDASTLSVELPNSSSRANKVFGFNSNGEPQASTNTLAAIDSAVDAITTLAGASSGSSASISHIASGTGAVATTVQAKLREIVSVKDFGAVGDGVADDKNAFVLANNTGKAIYVPSGTYNFGSAFSSTGSAAWVISPNVQFTGTQPSFERGVWSANAPDGTAGGNGVNLHRLLDRVLVGDANTNYNGELSGGATWPSNYGIGYYQAFSQFASFSSFGGLGVAGVSQSVDVPAGNDGTIGVAAGGVNNNTSGKSAWAYYGQAVQVAASGGTFTSGMELNTCSEKVSGDPTPFNITSGINIPHTHWVGVGGEFPQNISSNCKPISCGMIFASNSYRNATAGTGNLFRRGIVFQADAILGTDGVTGRGIAVSFAKGHSLEWDFLTGGVTYRGSRIRSDVVSISNPTGLVFNNDGFNVMLIDADPSVTTEKKLLNIAPIQNPVNNLSLKASATGVALEIAAEGTDTNIDIKLSPKTGGVLQYNLPVNALAGETLSGYMFIKDSGGTLRKVAIVS